MDKFRVDNLPPYLLGEVGEKILKARRAGTDVIDLSQVNPQVPPPAMSIDYLVGEVIREHNHRYSASKGITRLREAAAELYARRFSVELDPESEVIATMGSKEGLSSLMLSSLEPGDTVLLPTPAYSTYAAQAFFAGAKTEKVPLFDGELDLSKPIKMEDAGAGFLSRLEERYQSIWPRPKMLLVNFPNNPSTATAGPEFFSELVSFAKDKQILLVNDFSYMGIEFDSYKSSSLLSVPGAKDVAVELISLSKGFSLPGWRVGFAAGSSVAISALSRIKSYSDFGIFQPLQIAAARILESSEAILSDTSALYSERRDILSSGLEKLGWEVAINKATLFLWARVPQKLRAKGSIRVTEELLEQAALACLPGAGFDKNFDEFVRFSLVESPERLKTAIERLETCSLNC